MEYAFAYIFILASCVVGFLFGVFNYCKVIGINIVKPNSARSDLEDGEKKDGALLEGDGAHSSKVDSYAQMKIISEKIQQGANTFLFQEYLYLLIFIGVFSVVLCIVDSVSEEKFSIYTTIAFIFGALTSIVSGYIGMYVATRTNVRVTYMAAVNLSNGTALQSAFTVAFRGGCVMGFCLVSLALFILTLIIMIYIAIKDPKQAVDYLSIFEYISGYGLGGSSVALFCRVGGGIYTKAADVGADLTGKNVLGYDEDSPDNPATIADNVGDNVGDIAGMGSDLFGSLAESTCAGLVVSGTSIELTSEAYFFFPLLLTASGILACIVTSFFATNIMSVKEFKQIEKTLKFQLLISTFILTPIIVVLALTCLPETFHIGVKETKHWHIMICGLCGLYSGLIIGWFTDYYTSNAHAPTQYLAQACKQGAAINIIHGLALGYLSCIIPIICIAITIFLSFRLSGMYGISIAALGMLSNLATGLAIDGYGPISDNAGGISEMSEFPKAVRDNTDALDAAGNTTAAIGKGISIGSACLVSIALFGAFSTRTGLTTVNVLDPILFASLIVGAMIPYAFSAFTMKSVGKAAIQMCEEIKRQVKEKESGKIQALDHDACIRISTNASLKEMIVPGVMVIFTPLVLGFVFGEKSVAGYLTGVIVSGVQMAISASNSGGAWDNAKKYIEAKKLRIEESDRLMNDPEVGPSDIFFKKKTEPHKAAVVGDTVGDPLKDTSGPSINILIKLSAIVSLVFGTIIKDNHIFKLD